MGGTTAAEAPWSPGVRPAPWGLSMPNPPGLKHSCLVNSRDAVAHPPMAAAAR